MPSSTAKLADGFNLQNEKPLNLEETFIRYRVCSGPDSKNELIAMAPC